MKVSKDNRDQENIDERDFEKEKPAEPHQLVPAKTRQCPADPHHEENEHANFREKHRDVDQSKNPAVRAVRDPGKMPAAEKKRGDDSRAGDHRNVFAEK